MPDISESFEVDAVPYFILLRVSAMPNSHSPSQLAPSNTVPHLSQGHTLLTRLSGAQPSVLSAALSSHAAKPTALASTTQKPQPANTTYDPTAPAPAPGPTSTSSTLPLPPTGDESDEDEETEEELVTRCGELMTKSDVVLFMKGDRNTPRCGFSQKIVGILNTEGIDYTTFDILSDDSVRQSKSTQPAKWRWQMTMAGRARRLIQFCPLLQS